MFELAKSEAATFAGDAVDEARPGARGASTGRDALPWLFT
jgi:hypothetical protein